MNYASVLSALEGRGDLCEPADDDRVAGAQRELGLALPKQFVSLLHHVDGFLLHDGTCVFGASELIERNTTLEVREYLPGYVAIGDDSGGQAYMLNLDPADSCVYRVGVGDMSTDGLEPVAADLLSWLASEGFGCLTE